MAKGGKGELQSGLRVIDGWAIGSGAMIGVTIFVVSGTISNLAGPAACLGFIVACVLVFCVALCYCEIASVFPGAGGAYIFPRKVFQSEKGSFLSFISGWCLWGGQGLTPAVVTITTVGYLTSFINLIGGNVVLNKVLWSCILTVLYFVANWYGSSGGKMVQLLSTVCVVAVLIIFIIWGGINMKPTLLTPFAPNGFTPVLTCAAMCILSFSGWSTIPNMAEEFKNPSRDVPRASLLSLLTCGLLFSLFVYVMNGLLPGADLAASPSPPVAAMSTFTNIGAIIVVVGGLCACISTSNGLMMTGSRIPFAMGRDGDLPKALQSVNKHGVPAAALIATAIGQLLICLSGPLVYTLVSLSVCATSISWVITIFSSIVLRKKGVRASFRAPGYPITPVIAIFGLAFMFIRLSKTAIIMTVIWFVLGVFAYLLFNKTGLKNYCNPKKAEQPVSETAGG
ncbi:putative amino acid permease YhdG [bioreactor metagenome]|uniref:Putative amino acid permease YhdG n=1 Tax=bioreactor metagenome TaxID=1076179 RepID=A0A644WT64_9ZZZZ